jgi:hypothetical protein
MEQNYSNTLIRICQTLHKHGVSFLIVGGTAVGFHGYARPSIESGGQESEKPDFDFWYNPTYDNYFRLLNAIEDLGVEVSRYKQEKSPNPKKSFFRFDLPEFSVDILPSIQSQIKFRQAYLAREVILLLGVEIPFIGLDDLLADKQIKPRAKDLVDIEMLRKIKENGTLG